MNNSIIGAIGKLALVPGRNHRSSRITNSGAFAGSNHKRRGLRRAARQTVSAASNDSLRDKWREESDRRNLEGAGLIFSVKVNLYMYSIMLRSYIADLSDFPSLSYLELSIACKLQVLGVFIRFISIECGCC